MAERKRVDDPYRDIVGAPITGQQADDAMRLDSDETPFTDPTTQTVVLTYTVGAQSATADLAATTAVTIPDDAGTVTSVTYTPSGNVSAPTSGNSRTYTLAQNGTVASFVFDNTKSFATGTPVTFTISRASVTEGPITLASTHAGTGVADPGGTLSVTYTF